MNLFIDTNIYLNFYHFSNDDLEELNKLIVAIRGGEVKLWLPKQVKDEFRRNRENKIADALKLFTEQNIPKSFPQFCKDYGEYDEMTNLIIRYEISKKHLLDNLNTDIKAKNLKADRTIEDIFLRATTLEIDQDILTKAKNRFDRGNPPGKSGSYGDAINWEHLLNSVPNEEDLHIIARDKDYISQIDKNNISEFLQTDWVDTKKSNIFFYTNLSDFFSVHFPEIRLASELERKFAINNLATSGSFVNTHKAITSLNRYTDFSPQETSDLVDILLTNNQVSLINDDDDVSTFVNNFLEINSENIKPEKLELLREIYFPTEDDSDNSIEVTEIVS